MRLVGLHVHCPVVEAKEHKSHWGYHLLLDISGCNDEIQNRSTIETFIKDLVKAIDMKAVGEPMVKDFAEGTPLGGFSAMQFIETSSITIHFVNSSRTAYLDVFSCKDFDQNAAIDLVKERFGAKNVKQRFLYRDAE